MQPLIYIPFTYLCTLKFQLFIYSSFSIYPYPFYLILSLKSLKSPHPIPSYPIPSHPIPNLSNHHSIRFHSIPPYCSRKAKYENQSIFLLISTYPRPLPHFLHFFFLSSFPLSPFPFSPKPKKISSNEVKRAIIRETLSPPLPLPHFPFRDLLHIESHIILNHRITVRSHTSHIINASCKSNQNVEKINLQASILLLCQYRF